MMMAVQHLAVDPIETTGDEVVLVSSSSDPHIRRWQISLISATETTTGDSDTKNSSNNLGEAIREHKTSVYRLLFDSDEGDLWTASADGTTKCLSRAQNWSTEETIEHGDYVRAVALTSEWIITAGRDENVKVWDRNTGRLFFVYEGHFQEVTGLVVVSEGKEVLSVSIDGTLRTWPLNRGELEKKILEKEGESKGLVAEAQPEARDVLTEEEEAELAELMEDSE
jgi:WD40 repeat protein